MCVCVWFTKSAGDERFRYTRSVQLFLVLEHFLSMHFEPQLNIHTDEDNYYLYYY